MLLRRIVACLLGLCLLLALWGCGNQKNAPDIGTVTYTVKVEDEAGNPVTGATVQMCLNSCLLEQTDETGVAVYQTAPGDYKVSLVIVPAEYVLDTSAYQFEAGKQDMTITLQKAK